MSNLRLLTSLIKAKLETSSQQPVAAVSYVLARLATELRSIGSNPVFSDQITVSETTVFEIIKNLADEIQAIDVASVTGGSQNQEASDVATTIDAIQFIMSWARDYADAVAVDDLAAKTVTKNLSDAVTAIDQLTNIAIAQLFQESDSASTADVLSYALTKLVADEVTASDVFSRVVSYVRDFSDTATITEAVSIAMEISFQDSVTAVDNAQLLSDLLANASEDLAITDQFALEFTKELLESISTSETVAKDFVKALSEAVSQSEVVEKAVTKALEETLTTPETFAYDIYKYFAGADDVSVSDATAIDVSKPLAHSVSLTDVSVIDFVKGLTESLTAGDSGLLFATDYADISYFAEDFVGTSRTF